MSTGYLAGAHVESCPVYKKIMKGEASVFKEVNLLGQIKILLELDNLHLGKALPLGYNFTFKQCLTQLLFAQIPLEVMP